MWNKNRFLNKSLSLSSHTLFIFLLEGGKRDLANCSNTTDCRLHPCELSFELFYCFSLTWEERAKTWISSPRVLIEFQINGSVITVYCFEHINANAGSITKTYWMLLRNTTHWKNSKLTFSKHSNILTFQFMFFSPALPIKWKMFLMSNSVLKLTSNDRSCVKYPLENRHRKSV